jgi:hypothetical protein
MIEILNTLAIYAFPVILAITLHEAAHGYIARMFGDPTALLAGRVTLNPLRHIDPIGTIAVPVGILIASSVLGGAPMLFGWAKPVPVDFGRLRQPKKDMLWVALAGPASNLLMAIAWALSFKILVSGVDPEGFWIQMCRAGVNINLVLMFLNLLPILPLDGGRVLFSLLPNHLAWQYSKSEPYGMLVVLGLLATGMLSAILDPMISLGYSFLRLFL